VVDEQTLVDDVGELAFEAAPGLCGGFGFGEFALVVVTAGARVAGLADRDDVYCGVELAVAGAGESMASLVAAGGFDRGSTAVAGVVMPAGETGDVAAVSQDFRGQDGTEAVDVSQGAAGGFQRHDTKTKNCSTRKLQMQNEVNI